MEDELKDRKKKNPCRLVESIRSGPESVRIPRDREYGVVLEGGGAKGAFQIGAWRALSEAGIRQFGGVSGEAVIRGGIMRREKWKETCFSVRIRKNPITER